MPTLYIVATPIGNLEDISLRALRILGEVDFILCEDTRVTKRLLDHYKINTPTISFHEHSDARKIEEILEILAKGKNLALVADAGTPGISDPGGKLIQKVLERFGEDIYPIKSREAVIQPSAGLFNPVKCRFAAIQPSAGLFNRVKIEAVPGPSAVTAALSIAGIPTDKFVFMGFPPHKKGRQTFLRKILDSEYPVVVYESKYRILKFLEELKLATRSPQLATQYEHKKKINLTSVVVCRELSKMHETVYRGDLDNIIKKIKENKDDQRGEFVIIIGK